MSSFVFYGCGKKEMDANAIQAKEASRQVLFKNADASLKNADTKAAVLFAPELYNEGLDEYKTAAKEFDNDEELAVIEKKLAKAQEKFDTAAEISDKSAVYFKSTKTARDDAEKAGAVNLGAENWLNAEKSFRMAIEAYQDGKTEKADTYSREAEQLYRDAELNAIKAAHLGDVNKEIARLQDLGKKNNAPKILKKAEKLSNSVSDELDRQRYDNETAKKLTAEAEYEVKHAAFVNDKVKSIKENEGTFEDLILDQEADLDKIGNELELKLNYEKGFDTPVSDILGAVQKQKSVITEKEGQIDAHTKTIADLKGKLAEKEKTLETLSKTSEELKNRIKAVQEQERQKMAATELERQKMAALEMERQKKLAEELEHQKITAAELLKEKELQAARVKKLQSIQSVLGPKEGKVLLDGKNIIVRIYGLTFESGKSVIEPKFFGILSKVKQIIENYENSTVLIQGHTDAMGNEKNNVKLSRDRADSVKEYFLANTSLTKDRVTSMGYGSSQPVAKNTTKEGRAQNRRIDVVITPAAE
jgi:outer membrane protein OmpA-like peptidoglycan-associated protein